MSRPAHAALLTALLTAMLTALPATASAELLLAVDGQYAMPLGDGLSTAEPGTHLAGRIGYALPLPVVDIVLEVQGTQLAFPSELAEEKAGWAGYGITAGGRLGVDLLGWRPAVFAHIGYGDIEVNGSDYVARDYGQLVDVGLALTFTSIPFVGIGGHLAYSVLTDESSGSASDPGAEWFTAGLHFELRL